MGSAMTVYPKPPTPAQRAVLAHCQRTGGFIQYVDPIKVHPVTLESMVKRGWLVEDRRSYTLTAAGRAAYDYGQTGLGQEQVFEPGQWTDLLGNPIPPPDGTGPYVVTDADHSTGVVTLGERAESVDGGEDLHGVGDPALDL
jgi:hypothetical protein